MVVDDGGSSAEERNFEDVTEKRIIELQNLIQRGEEDVVRQLSIWSTFFLTAIEY